VGMWGQPGGCWLSAHHTGVGRGTHGSQIRQRTLTGSQGVTILCSLFPHPGPTGTRSFSTLTSPDSKISLLSVHFLTSARPLTVREPLPPLPGCPAVHLPHSSPKNGLLNGQEVSLVPVPTVVGGSRLLCDVASCHFPFSFLSHLPCRPLCCSSCLPQGLCTCYSPRQTFLGCGSL
jgi:hypothetical protein